VRSRRLSAANWNLILLAAAPTVSACGGGTRRRNRRKLHGTASVVLVSVAFVQQINANVYFFAVNGHCWWLCQRKRYKCRETPDCSVCCWLNKLGVLEKLRKPCCRIRKTWSYQPAEGSAGFPKSQQQCRRRTTTGGRGMGILRLARTRESDIRRPGGPAGVAVVVGRWGRATAEAWSDGMQLAPYTLHPTRAHTVGAKKCCRQGLLTDVGANSANSATSVRS
jgi:hypothetical protein